MRVTFHGTLLGLIMLVLATMAIGPARQLYDEQQAIRSDRAQLAAGVAEAQRLSTQIAQLQQPSYVEQLARENLAYVSPGQTQYLIVHPAAAAPAVTVSTTRPPSLARQIWDALGPGLNNSPL